MNNMAMFLIFRRFTFIKRNNNIITMIMTIRMLLRRRAFLRASRAVAPQAEDIKLDAGATG